MIDASQLAETASVKAALDTLIYGAEDTLDEITSAAKQHASNVLDAAEVHIADPVSAALQFVDVNLPEDTEAAPLDWSAAHAAIAHTEAATAGHEEALNALVDQAVASIGAHVADILPSAGDLLGTLAGVLSDLVSGLLGSLEETGPFWEQLYSILRDAFSQDKDPLGGAIADIVNALLARAQEIGAFPLPTEPFLGPIQGPQIPQGNYTVEQIADQFRNEPRIVQAAIYIGSMMASIFSLAGARAAPTVSAVAQSAMMDTPNAPLSTAEVAELLRRGVIDTGFAHQHARRSGLGPELFDLKYRLTERLLDTQALIELWRRFGTDNVLEELKQLGYSDVDIERLKELALAVPTASDVVRFLARDVFDSNAIREGGLDEDFELKYDPIWFNKAGVDKDTARLYWMAHWSLPSPTMGYEMLHRDIITQTQLTDLLKLADYAPGWVDDLVKISYNVPGRIDVRRMWESGIITSRDDLVARYRHMGYSPEDADVLATFTERLKEQQDAATAERTKAPIIRAVVQQYGKRATDYDTALQMLIGLGLTDDRARFLLQQGDFERAQDRETRITNSIGHDYVRGFLSKDDAFSRLENYGFGDTEIGQLFESWDLDRELAEWTEEKRHERDLNKSEVLNAYAERIIDRTSAAANLARLGYDSDEISTIIALEDAKLARADQRAAEQAIHTLYVNRRIDESTARSRLAALAIPLARVDALIAQWGVVRDEKTPRVTPAQLQKMLLQGIVTQDVIEERLRQYGYPEEDINMLLTMYGTEQMVQADALAEKIREFDTREQRLTRQGDARIGLQSRGLDIRETEFSQNQQAVQERFTASQQQQRALQQQRLDAASATQAINIAASTARQAASLEAAHERQAQSIAAANDRLDKQIQAADNRAAAALADREAARAQQAALSQQSQAAQTARQQAALAAQAARQQQSIDAANARAQASQAASQALNAQKQANTVALQNLRATQQQARDIRLNAEQIAREGRAEQVRIRTEQRADARKTITSADAAANRAALASLQAGQTSATAAVVQQFAALQAQVYTQQQQQLLAGKLAAEKVLADATPVSTLLDTSGF